MSNSVDVLIIGAGIAGAGVAAGLAGRCKTLILEQEDRPGYHTTGRSAAVLIPNYGNAAIRALTAASLPLFAALDPEFFPHAMLTPRMVMNIARPEGMEALEAAMAGASDMRPISIDEALALVPILKRETLAAAAVEDGQDIDVAALHQGWLATHRKNGGDLITTAPVVRITRVGGVWEVETSKGTFSAPIVINAAGAWADTVAAMAGLEPVGLQPLRRTIAVLPAPHDMDVRDWPLTADAEERWYLKPDGGRIFVSPADQVPVEPHDAYPDDMILAEGLDRFEQAVTMPVTRVERSWAGLRTFAPDKTPVCGFEPAAEGFFWLAGQGGYGIQTAPALSALAASQVLGAPAPAGISSETVAALAPDRFRN